MIRFACPVCKVVLKVSPEKAGSKASCPKCGQRLQSPAPSRSKTVLGQILPESGISAEPPLRPVPVDVGRGAPPPPLIHGAPRFSRWRRRAAVATVGAAVFVAIGWASCAGLRLAFPPAGMTAEKRSASKGADEELVRRYVLNNAEVADDIQFLVWGPHMLDDELEALRKEAGIDDLLGIFGAKASLDKGRPFHLIRVRYLDPHLDRFVLGARADDHYEFDMLFLVARGKFVSPVEETKGGDWWKEEMRKRMARSFPAIDTGKGK